MYAIGLLYLLVCSGAVCIVGISLFSFLLLLRNTEYICAGS